MLIKNVFCNHDWEEGKIQLASISFSYNGDIPALEFRTYIVPCSCKKCGKRQIKEKYIEKGLTSEEVRMLTEESERYAKAIGR